MDMFFTYKQMHILGEHTIRSIRMGDGVLTENAIRSTETLVNLGPKCKSRIAK